MVTYEQYAQQLQQRRGTIESTKRQITAQQLTFSQQQLRGTNAPLTSLTQRQTAKPVFEAAKVKALGEVETELEKQKAMEKEFAPKLEQYQTQKAEAERQKAEYEKYKAVTETISQKSQAKRAESFLEEIGIVYGTSEAKTYIKGQQAEYDKQLAEYNKQISDLKEAGFKPFYYKGELSGFEDTNQGMSIPLPNFEKYMQKTYPTTPSTPYSYAYKNILTGAMVSSAESPGLAWQRVAIDKFGKQLPDQAKFNLQYSDYKPPTILPTSSRIVEKAKEIFLGTTEKALDITRPVREYEISKGGEDIISARGTATGYIDISGKFVQTKSPADISYKKEPITIQDVIAAPAEVVKETGKVLSTSTEWLGKTAGLKTSTTIPSKDVSYGEYLESTTYPLDLKFLGDIKTGVKVTIPEKEIITGFGAVVKGIEFAPTIAGYVYAPALMLAGETAIGAKQYSNIDTIYDKALKEQYQIHKQSEVPEGYRHLTQEEFEKDYGTELKSEIKKGALMQTGIPLAMLATYGAFKAYKALTKTRSVKTTILGTSQKVTPTAAGKQKVQTDIVFETKSKSLLGTKTDIGVARGESVLTGETLGETITFGKVGEKGIIFPTGKIKIVNIKDFNVLSESVARKTTIIKALEEKGFTISQKVSGAQEIFGGKAVVSKVGKLWIDPTQKTYFTGVGGSIETGKVTEIFGQVGSLDKLKILTPVTKYEGLIIKTTGGVDAFTSTGGGVLTSALKKQLTQVAGAAAFVTTPIKSTLEIKGAVSLFGATQSTIDTGFKTIPQPIIKPIIETPTKAILDSDIVKTDLLGKNIPIVKPIIETPTKTYLGGENIFGKVSEVSGKISPFETLELGTFEGRIPSGILKAPTTELIKDKTITKDLSILSLKQKPTTKDILLLKQKPITKEILVQPSALSLTQKPTTKELLGQPFALSLKQKPTQTYRQVQVTPKPVPKPPVPKPPYAPAIILPPKELKKRFEKKIKKEKTKLVIPYGRRYGKFAPIGRPTTLEKARAKGISFLRKTLGATIEIKTIGGEKIAIAKDLGREFRPGKKGKDIFQIVQKAPFRLGSRGERLEIIQSRKAGGIKFI